MIKILFFGKLEEETGCREMVMDNRGTLEHQKKELFELHPGLKKKTYLIALNHNLCMQEDLPLWDEDIIALLPPVSGG